MWPVILVNGSALYHASSCGKRRFFSFPILLPARAYLASFTDPLYLSFLQRNVHRRLFPISSSGQRRDATT